MYGNITDKQLFSCNEPIEYITCEICSLKFYLIANLKWHTHFNRNVQQKTRYFCVYCKFETHSLIISFKHQIKCNRKNAAIQHSLEYGYKKMMILNDVKDLPPYQCELCDYKCKFEKNLQAHILYKHTADDKVFWFSCEECECKFKLKNKLDSHILAKHDKKSIMRDFTCSQCGYKARNKAYLPIHVLRRHTPDAEMVWFRCMPCNKKYKFESQLKGHMLRHHGTKMG